MLPVGEHKMLLWSVSFWDEKGNALGFTYIEAIGLYEAVMESLYLHFFGHDWSKINVQAAQVPAYTKAKLTSSEFGRLVTGDDIPRHIQLMKDRLN